MKNQTITYEDITKLYNELKLTSQRAEIIKCKISYGEVTNRNFGTKDYTISTNSSEFLEQYSKCSIDN